MCDCCSGSRCPCGDLCSNRLFQQASEATYIPCVVNGHCSVFIGSVHVGYLFDCVAVNRELCFLVSCFDFSFSLVD